MTYLILYLVIGLLVMSAVAYHDYVLEAEPDDHLSIADAFIYLVLATIWPIVFLLCLDHVLETLGKVLLWRRKD